MQIAKRMLTGLGAFIALSLTAQTSPASRPNATPANGPLRVHPTNPRYFTDGTKVSLVDSDHWFVVGLYKNPTLGRAWVWKSFCRGHNLILMEHLPPPSMVLSNCPLTPDDPGYIASRAAMGHTRRLAERMNLAAMTPSRDLASSRYCLADPGKEYLVYLPEGGAVTVDLTAVPHTSVVEWIHPVAGTITAGEMCSGGGKRAFTAPFRGDAVLHVREMQR